MFLKYIKNQCVYKFNSHFCTVTNEPRLLSVKIKCDCSSWLGIVSHSAPSLTRLSRLIRDAGMARNDRNPLGATLQFRVNISENGFLVLRQPLLNI